MPKDKDLVKLIAGTPSAKFVVDNDCWWMFDASENEIARDSDVKILGDGGYGSGNRYGGDILQALAVIVGVKIESV